MGLNMLAAGFQGASDIYAQTMNNRNQLAQMEMQNQQFLANHQFQRQQWEEGAPQREATVRYQDSMSAVNEFNIAVKQEALANNQLENVNMWAVQNGFSDPETGLIDYGTALRDPTAKAMLADAFNRNPQITQTLGGQLAGFESLDLNDPGVVDRLNGLGINVEEIVVQNGGGHTLVVPMVQTEDGPKKRFDLMTTENGALDLFNRFSGQANNNGQLHLMGAIQSAVPQDGLGGTAFVGQQGGVPAQQLPVGIAAPPQQQPQADQTGVMQVSQPVGNAPAPSAGYKDTLQEFGQHVTQMAQWEGEGDQRGEAYMPGGHRRAGPHYQRRNSELQRKEQKWAERFEAMGLEYGGWEEAQHVVMRLNERIEAAENLTSNETRALKAVVDPDARGLQPGAAKRAVLNLEEDPEHAAEFDAQITPEIAAAANYELDQAMQSEPAPQQGGERGQVYRVASDTNRPTGKALSAALIARRQGLITQDEFVRFADQGVLSADAVQTIRENTSQAAGLAQADIQGHHRTQQEMVKQQGQTARTALQQRDGLSPRERLQQVTEDAGTSAAFEIRRLLPRANDETVERMATQAQSTIHNLGVKYPNLTATSLMDGDDRQGHLLGNTIVRANLAANKLTQRRWLSRLPGTNIRTYDIERMNLGENLMFISAIANQDHHVADITGMERGGAFQSDTHALQNAPGLERFLRVSDWINKSLTTGEQPWHNAVVRDARYQEMLGARFSDYLDKAGEATGADPSDPDQWHIIADAMSRIAAADWIAEQHQGQRNFAGNMAPAP